MTTDTPSAPSLRLMGKGTLSRQLVLRVSALVAIIAITLSALTTLALHGILERQTDEQLLTYASQAAGDSHRRPGVGDEGPLGRQTGFIQYGDFTLRSDPGTTVRTGIIQTKQKGPSLLSDTVQGQLKHVKATGTPTTIVLDKLGPYRVIAKESADDNLVVVGLPTSGYLTPVVTLAVAAAALTLLAIVIAIVAARRVVDASLRPLQRLATTATKVSNLELDRGEVNVPVRVAQADTNPRSEVGQVGLAFNHMLDNVEGALDARQRSETKVRQFVADASHELRNPLASIKGYSELTRRNRSELPEDTAHALDRIESESERMSALVEDLLLLARLDSGPAVAKHPTNLNDVVADAVSDAQVAGPDHEWSLSIPEEDVIVSGDHFRLHQVVANLLSNARTHTPAGTSVYTTLSTGHGNAIITVADNGPGIPAEIRDRVFERFTRADASRQRRGKGGASTGLGLAIVQAVMAAHGGSAAVDSSPGHSTFTLTLPLAG